jgi:hypothetical protein
MRRKRSIVLAGLIIVACVGLLLWLRGPSEHVAPPAPAADARRPARMPLPLERLFAEGRAKAGEAPAASERQASSWGVEEAVGELLASEPRLRAFYNLRRKALRTAAEQQEYLALISDREMIEDARDGLLAAISRKDVDQVEEIKRLQHIQFFNSALAWADNPERASALSAVSDVVSQDVPAGTPGAVVGSVLGDKFDLFQLLVLTDPEQAKALLAKAQGTSRQTVLQLAWQTGVADLPKNKNPQP